MRFLAFVPKHAQQARVVEAVSSFLAVRRGPSSLDLFIDLLARYLLGCPELADKSTRR